MNFKKNLYKLSLDDVGNVVPLDFSDFVLKSYVRVEPGYTVSNRENGTTIPPGGVINVGNARLSDGTNVSDFNTFMQWVQQVGDDPEDDTSAALKYEISETDLNSAKAPFPAPGGKQTRSYETPLNSYLGELSKQIFKSKDEKSILRDREIVEWVREYFLNAVNESGAANSKSIIAAINKRIDSFVEESLMSLGVADVVFTNKKPQSQSLAVSSGTKSKATKKKVSEVLAPARSSINRLRGVIGSVFNRLNVSVSGEFKELLESVTDRENNLLSLELEVSSGVTSEREAEIVAEIANLQVNTEDILGHLVKSSVTYSDLFRAIRQNKIVLSQEIIKDVKDEVGLALKNKSLTREQRQDLNDRLNFLNLLDANSVLNDFTDSMSRDFGVSRADVVLKLQSLFYGERQRPFFRPKGEDNEDLEFNISAGDGFSVNGISFLRTKMISAFGFAETSSLEKLYPLRDFLATSFAPSLGINMNPDGKIGGRYNPGQIIILLSPDSKFKDSVTSAYDKVMGEPIPFRDGRVKNGKSVREALAVEDDTERSTQAKRLLRELKYLIQNNLDPTGKYAFLADGLERARKGNFFEKIPPEGSTITQAQIEANLRGRKLCENFAYAAGIIGSGDDMDKLPYKLRMMEVLELLSSEPNAYTLASALSIPLGVRVVEGELFMNEGIRESIEKSLPEEQKPMYDELKADREKVLFLMNFAQDNPHLIKFDMTLAAAARVEALEGKRFIEPTNEKFSQEKRFSGFKATGVRTYGVDLMKALDSGDVSKIEKVCRDAVSGMGITDEKQSQLATDYLLRAAKSHGRPSSQNENLIPNYTEAFVNLKLALHLGELQEFQDSQSSDVPVVLSIKAQDGTLFELHTSATESKGFGDSLLYVKKNGEYTEAVTLEQKAQKRGQVKIRPHTADTGKFAQMTKYVSNLMGGKPVRMSQTYCVSVGLSSTKEEDGEVEFNPMEANMSTSSSSYSGFTFDGSFSNEREE